MFDTLIESRRKSERKRYLGVGVVSLVMHTIIITAAVIATLTAGPSDNSVKVDTNMVYLQEQQQQKQPEPQPVLDVQLKGFQTVVAPTDIPTNIPPINLQEHFDPKDYSGSGVEGGVGNGIVPSSDQVLSVDVVQEKPERLAGPQPVYPPLLQQAGIQGVVKVEAIIDTTGHVEPNSVRVVESPNPGFDQAAKTVVLKSLYRPARVYGKAVRVLIQQPINFQISRH
ncbi:MAG TPA: energy transducer TonB [Gemmatimonadales bacterium]|nr:energy transducer TonB [Gemmatimonadales bacterium]